VGRFILGLTGETPSKIEYSYFAFVSVNLLTKFV